MGSAMKKTALGLMGALLLVATAMAIAAKSSSVDTVVDRAESAGAADGQVPAPLLLDESPYELAGKLAIGEAVPENHPEVENVFQLSPNIASGSEPLGRAGLERVAAMGVKTILSVDGKTPDAETAAELGMRYVHIPIQYKTITDEQIERMAKTFRELDGPFFVHCFHGRHRGPAAAAIGRIVVDGAPREQAMAEMRQWCGTAPNYEGLYDTVAFARIPSASESTALEWDFPAAHPFEGFRHSMVEMARVSDRIKAFQRRGWAIDPEHPDVDPVNEAAILLGHFVESGKLDYVKEQPEDFQKRFALSLEDVELLHEKLQSWKADGGAGVADHSELDETFTRIWRSCKECHQAYRN